MIVLDERGVAFTGQLGHVACHPPVARGRYHPQRVPHALGAICHDAYGGSGDAETDACGEVLALLGCGSRMARVGWPCWRKRERMATMVMAGGGSCGGRMATAGARRTAPQRAVGGPTRPRLQFPT
jgi:hypothetical protein